MTLAASRVPLLLLASVAAGACRPVSVAIDCPPSVQAETEYDVVFSVDKSGGGEATFEVEFSWSSPSRYLAEITYVAVDDEVLDPPVTNGYLRVDDVAEGDLTLTAIGGYCPNPDGACWGTLTASGSALKNGTFGADRESDACIIEYTPPAAP